MTLATEMRELAKQATTKRIANQKELAKKYLPTVLEKIKTVAISGSSHYRFFNCDLELGSLI